LNYNPSLFIPNLVQIKKITMCLQGLEQLYDFQKIHPDADIGPFLEKSSQFFQDYIDKGLKNIEVGRICTSSTTASSLSSPQGKSNHTLNSYPIKGAGFSDKFVSNCHG
jgi:hypothetical protein